MVTLLVLFYIPILILSDKFLGSLYPGALIIVIPSFLYLVIKQRISKLFEYDEIIFNFLSGLFLIITSSLVFILGVILLVGLAWSLWSIALN